jgi:hypothetical protein
MNEREEKYKILVMAILLAGACFLTSYFHAVLETGRVFIHSFISRLSWRLCGGEEKVSLKFFQN